MSLLALGLQISLGLSHAMPQDSGIWYLKDGPNAPYRLYLDSPSVGVGFEGKHWRVGYEYLGRFGSRAITAASYDNLFAHCPTNPCATEHFITEGKVHGLYGEYIVRYKQVGFEIGPTIYRSTLKVAIPDATGYNGSTWSTPVDVNLSKDSWRLGAIVGVRFDRGRFTYSLNTRIASNDTQSYLPSIVKGVVTNFQVRYNF